MREHARFLALVGAAPILVGGILTTIGLAHGGTNLWSSHWFFWGIIVTGLGAAIELLAVGMYVGSRETVAAGGGVRQRRAVLTMTPLQLTQPFHAGYTAVQAKGMTKQYLGKLLKVTGPLHNVYPPSGGSMMVTLDTDALDGRGVYLWFGRRRWKARLEAMSPGATLTVVGKIREVQSYEVKLGKCRLVDE